MAQTIVRLSASDLKLLQRFLREDDEKLGEDSILSTARNYHHALVTANEILQLQGREYAKSLKTLDARKAIALIMQIIKKSSG